MTRLVRALPFALLPVLAGCVQDSASYMIDGDSDHAIIVMRVQNWFWSSAVNVTVVAARQPDCLGGLDIKGVTRDTPLVLHQAPDEYAEPIYILEIKGEHYAVSTYSCRVQKFPAKPDDAGPEVGRYQEQDGKLRFVAAGKPG